MDRTTEGRPIPLQTGMPSSLTRRPVVAGLRGLELAGIEAGYRSGSKGIAFS